jgi:tRNA-splicing ligase RtcB
MWNDGLPIEDEAKKQLMNVARLPFVYRHVAAMPDVHWGIGATVGSVIPTRGAIIPAAVGVDIGCGMVALQTSLRAEDLPDNLAGVRTAIEAAVPHGRTDRGGVNDRGAWGEIPNDVAVGWRGLAERYEMIIERGPVQCRHRRPEHQLGTLGTGNHFIEICLDELRQVWILLHSGSRGPGNAIGTRYIAAAKKEAERWFISLPDKDLAYLPEGSDLFAGYLAAVHWAQEYARINRDLMMDRTRLAVQQEIGRPVVGTVEAIDCHHNYVAKENHFKQDVWVTRKGAVRAREGDLGIIPGSMGVQSYIVRGKGNPESFHSCSHGAGRRMSRRRAKESFTLEDHAKATEGVECRKDEGVLDETPGAYKNIDAVMAAQSDLVDVVHTLRQVVCVKG